MFALKQHIEKYTFKYSVQPTANNELLCTRMCEEFKRKRKQNVVDGVRFDAGMEFIYLSQRQCGELARRSLVLMLVLLVFLPSAAHFFRLFSFASITQFLPPHV